MRWVVNAMPWPLYPRERPGTHCIGGWVGPRAGLDGSGKISPPPGFDPRTVQPVAVAIPIDLSRPTIIRSIYWKELKKLSTWILKEIICMQTQCLQWNSALKNIRDGTSQHHRLWHKRAAEKGEETKQESDGRAVFLLHKTCSFQGKLVDVKYTKCSVRTVKSGFWLFG
jgi:hypothetical protein